MVVVMKEEGLIPTVANLTKIRLERQGVTMLIVLAFRNAASEALRSEPAD